MLHRPGGEGQRQQCEADSPRPPHGPQRGARTRESAAGMKLHSVCTCIHMHVHTCTFTVAVHTTSCTCTCGSHNDIKDSMFTVWAKPASTSREYDMVLL